MTIILRPEQEMRIGQAVQSGAYQDAQEVIDRALEMLLSQDEWLNHNSDGIAGKIERAFAQFERGEYFSAEGSKADMEERKAAWLHQQSR